MVQHNTNNGINQQQRFGSKNARTHQYIKNQHINQQPHYKTKTAQQQQSATATQTTTTTTTTQLSTQQTRDTRQPQQYDSHNNNSQHDSTTAPQRRGKHYKNAGTQQRRGKQDNNTAKAQQQRNLTTKLIEPVLSGGWLGGSLDFSSRLQSVLLRGGCHPRHACRTRSD